MQEIIGDLFRWLANPIIILKEKITGSSDQRCKQSQSDNEARLSGGQPENQKELRHKISDTNKYLQYLETSDSIVLSPHNSTLPFTTTGILSSTSRSSVLFTCTLTFADRHCQSLNQSLPNLLLMSY